MVATITRDKRVGFTTNTDYFEKAKKVAKANGTTISSVLDMFVKQMAVTGEVSLLEEKDLLFLQLQREIKQSIDDVGAGVKTYTIAEVRAELGL